MSKLYYLILRGLTYPPVVHFHVDNDSRIDEGCKLALSKILDPLGDERVKEIKEGILNGTIVLEVNPVEADDDPNSQTLTRIRHMDEIRNIDMTDINDAITTWLSEPLASYASEGYSSTIYEEALDLVRDLPPLQLLKLKGIEVPTYFSVRLYFDEDYPQIEHINFYNKARERYDINYDEYVFYNPEDDNISSFIVAFSGVLSQCETPYIVDMHNLSTDLIEIKLSAETQASIIMGD